MRTQNGPIISIEIKSSKKYFNTISKITIANKQRVKNPYGILSKDSTWTIIMHKIRKITINKISILGETKNNVI